MAVIDSGKAILCAVFAVILTAAGASAQQKAPSIFTVGGMRISADAENAVEAKKAATSKAQVKGLRLLLSRITDFRAYSRLPQISEDQAVQYVSEIGVRNEGVSATSYVATFSVAYSERAIRDLLSQYRLIPIEERGPEILIVPVYIEAGAARPAERNPWRAALTGLDLTHGLIPAKIAPARSDITAEIAKAYLAAPQATIDTLKSQYRAQQLLFAVADVDPSGDSVNLRLIGLDSLGLFSLQRKLKSSEGVDETLMELAARVALETVQERWKLTRSGISTAGAGGSGGEAAAGGGGEIGIESIVITAQYSGLKEWQTIRTRLQGLPGIQNWDLKSVNPRSAEISFQFPGGGRRLAEIAEAKGLSVENGPEGWVVKTR